MVGTLWSATLVRSGWRGSSSRFRTISPRRASARRAGTYDLARRARLPRLQGHRPETIAAALTDSPVGQALDCREVPDLDQPGVEDSGRGGGSRSAADQRQPLLVHPERRERGPFPVGAEHSDLDWIAPAGVPSGWVVFNTEPIMRRFMDRSTRWPTGANTPRAGHFPAMEEPALVDDLRASSAICADLSARGSPWRPSTLTSRFLEEAGLAQGQVRRDRCGARVGYSQHPVLSIKTVFAQQRR